MHSPNRTHPGAGIRALKGLALAGLAALLLHVGPVHAQDGGPDYWKVTGVASDDTLNLRSGPGTSNRVVARAPNGAVFRNLGCRGSGNDRWCHLETADGSVSGWAAGRFLTESGAPNQHTASGDDNVPELNVRNTGEYEVRFASGCTALFNPSGGRINAGSSCSRSQLTHAHDAVERYMREQGGNSVAAGGSGGGDDLNLSGRGQIYGGGIADGRVFGHREGHYAVMVTSIQPSLTCTAALQHSPLAVHSESTSMHCSNGASGLATIVQNRNGNGHTLTFSLSNGTGGYVLF